MFNLEKLNSAQIIKLINEHQHSFVKLVLIVGSLLIAGGIFTDYRMKVQALQTETAQAEEKLGVIKDHEAAINDVNNFKSSSPKQLNVFSLVTLISDYAKSCNVTIASYTPDQNKDMGLYDVINVHFNMASDDFKNMMVFLRKIEKSKFPLRIDSWSGHQEADGTIAFSILVTAVLIHT